MTWLSSPPLDRGVQGGVGRTRGEGTDIGCKVSDESIPMSERPSGSSLDTRREDDPFRVWPVRMEGKGESEKRGLSKEPSLYVLELLLVTEWDGDDEDSPSLKGLFRDSMVHETWTEGGEGGTGEGDSSCIFCLMGEVSILRLWATGQLSMFVP